jgi:septal ring factor EnvC (AmiA/AmiB activator)
VTAPIGGPPLEHLPPNAPATVEDVRASRRWTWVALAWAIAASAIAVIALLQDSGSNNNQKTTTQPAQTVSPKDLQDFQNQTNDRLDALSGRLNDTASKSDLQKLDTRLTKAQNDASQAKSDASKQASTITQLQADVKDLQQRVSDLENQQQQQGQSTTP